ncbi:hypothetical protein Q7C36_018619 [Tachysurus vachellii]|uniref:Semaphorin-3C n=1 Tax=Tachysurus vachellii TaxID=175792 RepID=A0AA88M1E7_TACVA|nr:hypothetical protein Q7C36_018619 [Tachysurus vachellii]
MSRKHSHTQGLVNFAAWLSSKLLWLSSSSLLTGTPVHQTRAGSFPGTASGSFRSRTVQRSRTSWRHEEMSLVEFSEPGVFNYSTLLLNEERGALYVGAREAIFQLDINNVSVKNNQVLWKVPSLDKTRCTLKGKSEETDCRNYIQVLQVLDEEHLFVCGTHAFQPLCDYLSLKDFMLMGKKDDGRGKCPYDPTQSFTTVMVDGELYSGTSYNFLGSEPIISRFSRPHSLLRTEYSTSWLNEPRFVFADVIREGSNSPDGDDDKIYYFFTEVSVEYEFFGKLLIPRIARVCKGDLGGQRTLQKKWTSFLKAKLVCSMPELNFVFNVVHDVFIVKTSDWRETVIYGVFTSQWGNMGLSAVCAYNMTTVDEVFSKGKYMQKAMVEQSHTKWVQYNGITPSPRPGACITNQNRMQNITNSLLLPDKTLQFVKDHPLMADPVLPIGQGPRLTAKDVNYTQIVVERVTALDNSVYDVLFTATDKGFLHKSVVYEGGSHIIEEIQLLKNSQPIKTLLLSTKEGSFLYAGSDSGVIQSPTAFCDKYVTCADCVLTRDPYCAWDTHAASCINIFQKQDNKPPRKYIQNLKGDADKCPSARPRSINHPQQMVVKPGSSAELACTVRSNLAQVFWKVNDSILTESAHFLVMGDSALLIYSVAPQNQGHYECWTVESAAGKNFTRLEASYILRLERSEIMPMSSVEIIDVPNPDPSTSRTTTTTTASRGNNGNSNTAGPSPLTPSTRSSVPPPPLTRPATTANVYGVKADTKHYVPPQSSDSQNQGPEIKDPHAKYLQYDNSKALLFLFLLFFLLFLCGLVYNCYMQYLPGPCLRLRAAMLGSQKKPQREYAACEGGLMEVLPEKRDPHGPPHQNGALRDTGYETETEYGNGKIPSNSCEGENNGALKQGPFDVKCESDSIKYADADES